MFSFWRTVGFFVSIINRDIFQIEKNCFCAFEGGNMVTTEYVFFQMECRPFISIIRLYFFMLWILTLWQLTTRLVAVKTGQFTSS